MKKVARFFLMLILLGLPVFVLSTTASAQFDPLQGSCLDEDGNIKPGLEESAVCQEAHNLSNNPGENPVTGTSGVILRVADILAFVAGVAAVIIVIVSGVNMILSGGDASKIQSSRNAIIFALVGALVIILSRSIIIFIINRT